jgi:hypothetical protein
MALLNTNRKIMNRAMRVARRVDAWDVWMAMPSIAKLTRARDPLETRAMWRRQGLPLERRATVVGGKLERFLAP